MKRVLRLSRHCNFPSVIIDNLHVKCVSTFPSKNDTPLIVDPDRMKPAPVSLEPFETIAGRCAEIPELGRVVQIQQFPPRGPTQLRRKCSCGSGAPIIEQILGQSISEGLDHVPILSEFDNPVKKLHCRVRRVSAAAPTDGFSESGHRMVCEGRLLWGNNRHNRPVGFWKA